MGGYHSFEMIGAVMVLRGEYYYKKLGRSQSADSKGICAFDEILEWWPAACRTVLCRQVFSHKDFLNVGVKEAICEHVSRLMSTPFPRIK